MGCVSLTLFFYSSNVSLTFPFADLGVSLFRFAFPSAFPFGACFAFPSAFPSVCRGGIPVSLHPFDDMHKTGALRGESGVIEDITGTAVADVAAPEPLVL